MEKVEISEHLTYKKLFKINIGPILMMLFISTYSIVDGLFIANFSNNTASFAGVNLIWPVLMIVGGIGFMFGTGGSALVSKRLGEGNKELANKTFTNIFISAFVTGLVLSILGFIFTPQIAEALASVTEGSTPDMVNEATKYGRILMCGMAFFMLQNMFQNFLMVDGRPNLGFTFTLICGVSNIILDFLFVVVFKMGCQGAALGTLVGYIIGSVGPTIFFFKKKTGNIYFAKPTFDVKSVLFSCYNGMSEFFSNISNSIVGILFNYFALKFYGEIGVSAYGIVMYVILVFLSIFIGFCIGTTPFVGYNYGAKNTDELKNILKKSMMVIGVSSLMMVILCFALAEPIVLIFANGDQELIALTIKALRAFSIAFGFCGFSMFISNFFTGLGNGTISAILSVCRTFILQIGAIVLLPIIFNNNDAIWFYAAVQEGLALLLSFVLLFSFKKKYNY